MAEQYQLLSTSRQSKHDRDDSSSIQRLRHTTIGVGKPQKQTAINVIDCAALAIILMCAVATVLVIIPALSIAASLQFENQIIIIGLLLSVMQICQQRLVQRLMLALEASSKTSTIHNIDGLLRWSFLTPHFGWNWRAAIVILLALPLALSVLYKRFIGGSASAPYSATFSAFQSGGLAGVTTAGSLAVFANKTNALVLASADESLAPTSSQYPRAYGSSMLLISDGTAAALDEPENILEIQRSLPPRSTLFFSADVRGTVSVYNNSLDSHRSDETFWYSFGGDFLPTFPINNDVSCQFGLQIQRGSVADNGNSSLRGRADESYALVGGFAATINGSTSDHSAEFFGHAFLFNTLRYNCHGEWRLTPSTFDLVTGTCSPQPLPSGFQYLKNAALNTNEVFTDPIGEILGPYSQCGARNGSSWYKPSAAALLSAAYSARLATVPIYPMFSGSVYTPPITYSLTNEQIITGGLPRENVTITVYDQSYQPTNVEAHIEVPTLDATWGLYVVIMVQPLISTVAFVSLMLLRHTPISAGFGLVSMLAGVDRQSLDVLKGASFSGELSKKVGIAISILDSVDGEDEAHHTVTYTVGETGFRGKIRRGFLYG